MKKLTIKRAQQIVSDDVDLTAYLRKYIQSYLYWLYIQNNKFEKRLSSEELTNFFFNEIEHPIWFIYLLQTNTFKICTEVNNYISRYKKKAELMEPEISIIPKHTEIAYTSIGWPVFPKATLMQKEQVLKELQGFSFTIPESMTQIDAILIHKISQYNKKRGVVHVK